MYNVHAIFSSEQTEQLLDFDWQVQFSPDICLDGLDELKSRVLPGSRRSKRLKRKSIELCRRAVPVLPPPPAATGEEGAATGMVSYNRNPADL